MLASAQRVLDAEIAADAARANATAPYWSWVDALFMSMNTYGRRR
jgi:hypothetical protein